jgi:hypothetical protein
LALSAEKIKILEFSLWFLNKYSIRKNCLILTCVLNKSNKVKEDFFLRLGNEKKNFDLEIDDFEDKKIKLDLTKDSINTVFLYCLIITIYSIKLPNNK